MGGGMDGIYCPESPGAGLRCRRLLLHPDQCSAACGSLAQVAFRPRGKPAESLPSMDAGGVLALGWASNRQAASSCGERISSRCGVGIERRGSDCDDACALEKRRAPLWWRGGWMTHSPSSGSAGFGTSSSVYRYTTAYSCSTDSTLLL